MQKRSIRVAHVLALLALATTAAVAAGATANAPAAALPAVPAATGAPLALPSAGGGSLGSLTVEGTSQVRIRFQRPALKLDLDPLAAPGLEPESPLVILERRPPDLARPLLAASAGERSARTPRPWLTGFTVGTLARLRPDLRGVARWQLEIVDAGGAVVRTQTGEGTPPRELTWDGLRDDGTPVPAGLACSHVLTARDKAGNARRFVGDSFTLPAYRVETATGPCLLFSAGQWHDAIGEGGVSPLLAEAATVLNLRTDPGRPLVVAVTAATADEATALGNEVAAVLAPLVGGGEGRVRVQSIVTPGAPAGGTATVGPLAP